MKDKEQNPLFADRDTSANALLLGAYHIIATEDM
jgi:hypothetical protein